MPCSCALERIGRSRGVLLIGGTSRNSKWIVLTAIFLFIHRLPTSCLNASQALGGVMWARTAFRAVPSNGPIKGGDDVSIGGKNHTKALRIAWTHWPPAKVTKTSQKLAWNDRYLADNIFKSPLLTKIFEQGIKCHLNMVLRTINQHWFKWWLGSTKQHGIHWTNVDKDSKRTYLYFMVHYKDFLSANPTPNWLMMAQIYMDLWPTWPFAAPTAYLSAITDIPRGAGGISRMEVNVKISLPIGSKRKFSDMASDWLASKLTVNEKPC